MAGGLNPVTSYAGVPSAERLLLNSYCQPDGTCTPDPGLRSTRPRFNEATPTGQAGVTTGASGLTGLRAATCVACSAASTATIYPPFIVTDKPAMVNGLVIAPQDGASIVLDTNDGLLVSSNASVTLTYKNVEIPLRSSGPLWVPTYSTNGDIPLFDTNLDPLETQNPSVDQALDLVGFVVDGTLTVDFVRYQSKIQAGLALPSTLSSVTGKTVTSTITAYAPNATGLVLDDLFVAVPSVTIGKALNLSGLTFCYQAHISESFCQTAAKETQLNAYLASEPSAPSWSATGTFQVLGIGIAASPPPPNNGIGFVNGNLAYAGATVNFGSPGIPIGTTGVGLTSIGGGFSTNPLTFNGTLGVDFPYAAPIFTITGNAFLVLPGPQGYTFTGGELGSAYTSTALGACCGLPTVYTSGPAFAVGGNVSINLGNISTALGSIGQQQLADAWILYATPGYFAAGGSIGWNLNLPLGMKIGLTGGVSAQFELAPPYGFNITGGVQLSVPLFTIGANAVVSNVGIAACGNQTVAGVTFAEGTGYNWGGGINFMIGSCSLSNYTAVLSSPAPALRGHQTPSTPAGYTVPVAAGLLNEMIKVVGSGGAPNVSITGADGLQSSSPSGTEQNARPFVIYDDAETDTTYVAIIKPPAGEYVNYVITARGCRHIRGPRGSAGWGRLCHAPFGDRSSIGPRRPSRAAGRRTAGQPVKHDQAARARGLRAYAAGRSTVEEPAWQVRAAPARGDAVSSPRLLLPVAPRSDRRERGFVAREQKRRKRGHSCIREAGATRVDPSFVTPRIEIRL
jgi:hypothetical protein